MTRPNAVFFVACGILTGIALAARGEELSQLPSGPPSSGPFGAVYTKLKYDATWDASWRVGSHPDVVVRFADGGHRLVFWRGTSYIPCWVSDAGVWYTNEFVERRGHHSPNTEGCVEPMSDKQCRYSHVRVIESHDARVVIHWRYAPVDVDYEHPFIDEASGWFDWVDEYYTIYPDAVGVRKITVHTSRKDLWTEFQESIVVNQPGTLPDDNLELGAVSVANLNGESNTYVWTEDGAPEFDGPADANILKVNVKGTKRPFAIAPPPKTRERMITPYEGHGRRSHFNWWDHWPVSQAASDGRAATSAERPSHSSLCHIALHEPQTWEDYAEGDTWRTKLMLHGMTNKPVDKLVPLAKSWLTPAELRIDGDGFISKGYDPTQMAYIIAANASGKADELRCVLTGSEDSSVVNPVLVVTGWGRHEVALQVNGEPAIADKDYRAGYTTNPDGTTLIVWIQKRSDEPVRLALMHAAG